MKSYIHLVIAILLSALALLSGCRHTPDERLLHAESIMEQHPDSALMILEDIDVSRLASDADLALHGLLLTQAMDKNHLDPVNDTIISHSVDFFKRKNDIPHLIKASYYHGRVRYHQRNNQAAIVSFFNAKDLAESVGDNFWAGMSCRGIADIYNKTYNAAEELNYARKEYDYIRKSGRQPYLNYALYDLGGALHNSGHIEEAIDMATLLCDSARKYDDPYLDYCAKQLMVLGFTTNERFEDACRLSKEICNGEFAQTKDSLLLCETLIERGLTKEASSLMDEISDSDLPFINNLRYKMAKYNGDYAVALRELENLDSIDNDIIRKSMNHDLTTSLTDYYQMKANLDDSEIRAANATTLSVIFVSSFIILILVGVGRFIYIRQNRKIEEKVLLAEQLWDTLKNSNQEKSYSVSIIKFLMTSKFEMLDDFCYIVLQNTDSSKARKQIADAVTRLIEELSINGDRIADLEKQVDRVHNNIFTDFKNDLPDLKEADYRLFLFCILGLSTDSISLLLKETGKAAVYNRKKRLKEKIRKLDVGKQEKYFNFL